MSRSSAIFAMLGNVNNLFDRNLTDLVHHFTSHSSLQLCTLRAFPPQSSVRSNTAYTFRFVLLPMVHCFTIINYPNIYHEVFDPPSLEASSALRISKTLA